jgi:hypothetical protein
MKRFAVVLLLVSSPALAWHMFGAAHETPSDFQITMKTTARGVEMECHRGCAWTKLTFGCDGKIDCAALLDAHGVQGVHVTP